LFEAVYFSAWHNPAAIWLVALAFGAVLVRSGSAPASQASARSAPAAWLSGYLMVFTAAIAIDALCSGAWSPTEGTALATPIAIFFVILGDFRFFLLLERFAPESRSPHRWAQAAGWALLIPVGSTVARKIYPAFFENPRITFLTYEAAFVVLALVFRFVIVPRRFAPASPGVRRWIAAVTTYQIVQYALWATADVVILSGIDAGYALRLAPNLMYYAFFVPFVWWTAPRDELAAARGAS
jgi:hypothetical protein